MPLPCQPRSLVAVRISSAIRSAAGRDERDQILAAAASTGGAPVGIIAGRPERRLISYVYAQRTGWNKSKSGPAQGPTQSGGGYQCGGGYQPAGGTQSGGGYQAAGGIHPGAG
jgi:hypothetical protein